MSAVVCVPETQWMVFSFLGIYFVAFVLLQIRLNLAEMARFDVPLLWLAIGTFISGAVYAIQYSPSTRPLELLAATVIGRSIRFSNSGKRWSLLILSLLISFLALAAIWQPGLIKIYAYRGNTRWNGPWDNPNVFGLLMGVGTALAAGLAVGRWKIEDGIPKIGDGRWEMGDGKLTKEVRSQKSEVGRYVVIGLCLVAVCLVGRGLLHSYSRGAWVATAGGLGYLMYQVFKRQESSVTKVECGKQKAEIKPGSKSAIANRQSAISHVSWLKNNWLALSVVLLSVVILLFWHFRQTEWHPARRAFSAVNPVDFSWRNRVAAWEGALQIMAEKPWFGTGWNQPELLYENYYLSPKLTESAAIQMNDYLMLGATLGITGLFCFAVYIWLSLSQNLVGDEVTRLKLSPNQSLLTSSPKFQELGDGAQGTGAPYQALENANPETGGTRCPTLPTPSSSFLAATCRAGAIVLLVGFWFDGGLFKLPTAATFWILLELGNCNHQPRMDTNKHQ